MVQNQHNVPQVVVYCDESCHDLTAHHEFMAIGSLWVSREKKADFSRAFRELCRDHGLRGEVKWRKVSVKRLDDYRALVDFFFEQAELRFRAIVVEQSRLKMNKFHGRDKELAFYKFYYEMLEKWLDEGREYLILLDFKENKGANRYIALKTYLERFLRGKAWISDLTVIDSRETPLAQLCDLLTGAVAAAYNGRLKAGGAKENLAKHIAKRAGFLALRVATPRGASKFNIFKIDLA